MRPHQHIRDAAALIAKAPPFAASGPIHRVQGNVIRFPSERRSQQAK